MASKPESLAESAASPARWSRRLRPAVALMVLGLAWSLWARPNVRQMSREPQLSQALLGHLAQQGLLGTTADLRWVDAPQPTDRFSLSKRRFAALLRRKDEAVDVWLGTALLTPEGRLLDLSSLHNISDTSAVGEASLSISGDRVGWTVEDEGLTLSLHVADLRGLSLDKQKDWTALDRLKTRVTFLQDTGQAAGIREQVYRLDPPRSGVRFVWFGKRIRVTCGSAQAEVDESGHIEGNLSLVAESVELGQPGDLVTWGVDRMRAVSWFGSDRMQWIKTIAFSMLDYSSRVKSNWVDRDGSSELKSFLGDTMTLGDAPARDPEAGWPPAPIAPLLTPALPREGSYAGLDDDAFAVPPEGGASPFAFTFLRPDPSRTHSQVFIVAYDPRRIELHVMTGTREPKTATGETGPGRVPRDLDRVGRLAAAFNGGFQATHGEFGMMADGVVYLPPKPYAATVAELDDGSTGFGTWSEDPAIGPEFIGYRQNLTPLIANGQNNPYRRTWWGGVPPGWEDATRTVRTGLCLTKDQHVAYFYGSSIDAEHLTIAMNAARCTYAVHLDMNPGHTGLEFYRVGPTTSLPQLNRKLDSSWEATGNISEMPGFSFLGRRMIHSMHLMNFPRYVRTDARDFIYLTHRAILSDERLRDSSTFMQPKGLTWQIKGLPQHGFPPAIATAKYSPDLTRPNLVATVMLIDGKWASPCERQCHDQATILSTRIPSERYEDRVVYSQRRFRFVAGEQQSNAKTGSDTPQPIDVARGRTKAHATASRAAVGITNGQWLYYIEITAGADPTRDVEVLDRALADFGCKSRLFLDRPLSLTLGAPSEEPAAEGQRLAWLRNDTPLARPILTGTPVVPYKVWAPLQAQRVRYKRQSSAKTQTSHESSGATELGSAESPKVLPITDSAAASETNPPEPSE